MKIREFRLDDYQTVFDLWKEAGLDIMLGDDLDGVRLKLQRDPDLFLVAEEKDRIVGTVMGTWDCRRGWIWHLAVRSDHRKKGVGKELIMELEKRLSSKGATRVLAMVDASNQRSFDFFKAAGFWNDPEARLVLKDIGKKQNRVS